MTAPDQKVNFLLTDDGFFINGERIPTSQITVKAAANTFTVIEATFTAHPSQIMVDVNLLKGITTEKVVPDDEPF